MILNQDSQHKNSDLLIQQTKIKVVICLSATIIPSSLLNEANLDVEYITVTLGEGETFKDYLNLEIESFALVGEPPGIELWLSR